MKRVPTQRAARTVATLTVTLALGAGALVVRAIPAPASSPSPAVASSAPAAVDPAAERAIAAAGSARVHVVLRGGRPLPPDSGGGSGGQRYLDEVASAQAALRASLPAQGVRLVRLRRWAFAAVADVDAAGLEALRRNPRVERVYLDGAVHAMLAEGRALINADVLHGLAVTGAGVTVAIIDTGIDYTHPALGGCFGAGCRVVDGYDFYNGDPDPIDDGSHGTGMAGIVAASSATFVGVAPDARLVALKVLAANGFGTFTAIDDALDWVLTHHAAYDIKVANMSLGDGGQYDDPAEPLCSQSTTALLVNNLLAAGVAVTVATGNNAYDNGISFPACIPSATAVAGVYDADVGAATWCVDANCNTVLCSDLVTGPDDFMCRGNTGSTALTDLLAPSWKATTTGLAGGTRESGGTSSSAAYAAGAFALMFDAEPAAGVAVVEGNLKQHGVPVPNPQTGRVYPRIDLEAALQNFDNDLDRIAIASDNCPQTYNPSQSDGDADTLGDACDNCPAAANATQANGDGDPAGTACDCDDASAAVWPGAPETCDGLNNDCAHPAWPSLIVESDDDVDGLAECAGDCDDGDPAVRAGIPEACDGIDNDCNGAVPADEADLDVDGWRLCNGECDDLHDAAHPGGIEVCDGLDNDCDGVLSPNEVDADRDGFRLCSGECDDTRASVHPGAPEICDGLDNDCDTLLPPGDVDADGDGALVCAGDCDDDAIGVYPGAPEICDGRNNDCLHAAWPSLSVEVDDDGDGPSECQGDCDDATSAVRPGRPDVCNDVDDDCDGHIDPNYPILLQATLLGAVLDPNGGDTSTFGAALAPAGDLTGDGVPDLLAGAPRWPPGLSDRGSVLVVSGATHAPVLRLTSASSSGAARLGDSVRPAGPGSGADVLAGAPGHVAQSGLTRQGRVVRFDSATGAVLWTYDDATRPSNADLGASVAPIGDLNGDGEDDVLAGAPGDCAGGFACSGSVWVLDGRTGAQVTFVTDEANELQERFGAALVSIGDLNGDGREDFAVGAPNKDVGGLNNSGGVVLVSGLTFSTLAVLSDPTPAARDQLGSAIALVPDVDGDGRDDLLVGAPGHTSPAGLDAGQALLLSVASGATLHRLSDPNGAAGDRFGSSVSAVGDLDRDGVAEILVGSPFADAAAGADAGAAFLFSGRTGVLLARLEHSAGVTGDHFGASVAGLPPLDGDGVPEIAAGAPEDDAALGEDAGTVTILSPEIQGDCDGDLVANAVDSCTDVDLDGYGSAVFLPPACPVDCDDDRASVHPGATEICDGLDTDCDGGVPPSEADADGDGVVVCAGDCDDTRAGIRPGAPQVCDGFNNDCLEPSWPSVPAFECFEIENLVATDPVGLVELTWDVPAGGADLYRVYRGTRADLDAGNNGGECFTTSAINDVIFADNLAPGELVYYLVAGVRSGFEGSRGTDTLGAERNHAFVCP